MAAVHTPSTLSTSPTARNLQLDGWRAFAVLGVMWLHWSPREWRGWLPFEVGLYYFLCLTGFLITRILLREKAKGEGTGAPWRFLAFTRFQQRRALRILVPCFVAMIFAWLVGAPDIRSHPLAYFFQVVNFHMAFMPGYASGTAHYWTLAIQQQFYLLWPVVIFCLPARALLPVLLALLAVGPLSRAAADLWFPQIHHPGMLTPCALDFLVTGSLLAWAMHRGLKPGDRRVSVAAVAVFIPYALLYWLDAMGHPAGGFRHLQQLFGALFFAGLISATLAGFSGLPGRLLEHPVLQKISQLSYGLYLFHTPMPLLVGLVMPFLWSQGATPLMTALQILAFSAFSWGAALLCYRYLEQPMERMKARSRPGDSSS